MDSDKTTGPCGLSGSSQCRTVLIRGLRSFPPSGGTQNSQATQQIAKKLLDWPDSTMLGEWELRGHSPACGIAPCLAAGGSVLRRRLGVPPGWASPWDMLQPPAASVRVCSKMSTSGSFPAADFRIALIGRMPQQLFVNLWSAPCSHDVAHLLAGFSGPHAADWAGQEARPGQASSGPTMPPAQTGGMGLHKVETTPPAAANPEPPTQTSRLFRIKPFADPQNSFGPGLQI
ncbi:hypothetical protein LA080_010726 [Diaporthe eres]|nr:hypothetical protein LA080_010726 [Diaporthe eres]